MKKLVSTLLIILLSFNFTYGQVKFLEKGAEAPYSGYLFTPEKEQELRIKNSLVPLLEEQSKKQNEIIDIQNKRIESYQKNYDVLYEEYIRREKMNDWNKVLYFGIGSVVTGFIAYGLLSTLNK